MKNHIFQSQSCGYPKKAAINQIISQPFHHRPLKSAGIRCIKPDANRQWTELWKENTKIAHILRRMLDVKARKTFYSSISSRNTVATLIRLRTGHCGLNQYPPRLNLARTPYCRCGYAKETAGHFLLECRPYYKQRQELRRKIGPGKMTVEKLLRFPKKFVKHTMEYGSNNQGSTNIR
jgi:hypothetical protein